MDAFTFSTIVAILAFVAVATVLAVTIVRFTMPLETRAHLADAARWLAWAVAATATIGSLIYSEVYLFEPCLFCWYQRIAMYPLAAILLVGAIRRDPNLRWYGLPLSVVGLGFSIWHVLVQNVSALQGSGACDPNNPCSAKYVDLFGFVSIPWMAGAGFLLITVLLAFFAGASGQEESSQ